MLRRHESGFHPTSPRFPRTEVAFQPPPGWAEATVVSFRAPPSGRIGAKAPSLTMSRVQLLPGETLRTHADRRLARAAKDLPGFDFLESEDLVVAGRPAVLQRFAFAPNEERVEQTTVLIGPGSESEARVTVFAIASLAAEAEHSQPLFRAVLDSVRFEPGDDRPSSVPLPPPSSNSNPEFSSHLVPMPGRRMR
jgi:hypothetical protein